MKRLMASLIPLLLAQFGLSQEMSPHADSKTAPKVIDAVEQPSVEGAQIVSESILAPDCEFSCRPRRLFESDRAFPGFISPITNPILSKDPRSMTEARFLFVQNWIPDEHPLDGGDFQVYALQLRLALTERLQLFADRDGIAVISPGAADSTTGLLNLAFGLRYWFIRDVEKQLLASGGLMYEVPTGEADVFQNHGSGVFTVFGTAAKEIAQKNHAILNVGYQFPTNTSDNSSFFYTSVHFDRQVAGFLYPLVEFNWYAYTDGGNRLPSAIGEGDGLLNLGTRGVAGNHLVTAAVGLTALLGDHIQTGVAYETPLTERNDLINNRLLVEFILRY